MRMIQQSVAVMGEEHGSLERTPTWAVAAVCSVFVVISLVVERGINCIGMLLKKRNEKPLSKALDKMREELMLMGFISLLLSVFQPIVSEICMPQGFLDHMLPCRLHVVNLPSEAHGSYTAKTFVGHNRKLLSRMMRNLLSTPGSDKCTQEVISNIQMMLYHGNEFYAHKILWFCWQGKVAFISSEGLHQLHIFIFVMAIVHLCYSCLTMLLGRTKIHWWRSWELEILKVDHVTTNIVLNMTFSKLRQRTFIRDHAKRPWSASSLLNWIVAFLRHLSCRPVTRADYLTLRTGFLRKYNIKRDFDFHKYITRVLEDDFKMVVGISGYLWAFVVSFLLMNVHGWHTYFWMAFVPLILILIVGSKLQGIVTELALEIAALEDEHGKEVVVQPRDELFWFNRPYLVLHLIHFTLFQNAFELAFFFWILTSFGPDTCFLENRIFIIVRLIVGIGVQFICSYSTLPLYVLVTQMGSNYRRAIFNKRITRRMRDWHKVAKKNVKANRGKSSNNTRRGFENPAFQDSQELRTKSDGVTLE